MPSCTSTITAMSKPEVLSMAVCLFPDVQLLDYAGPVDLFGFISSSRSLDARFDAAPPSHLIDLTFLAPSEDPVRPRSGPAVLPDLTYDKALEQSKQYDVLLVPGGTRRARALVVM